MYSGILQQKPDARWKPLEDLVKRQSQGMLHDSLRKTCGAQKSSSNGAETMDPMNGNLHLACRFW